MIRKYIFLYVLWMCADVLVAQIPSIVNPFRGDEAAERWVEHRMSAMSLKEKIGQLFIHTVAPIDNQYNRDNIRKAVEDYKIGGLLFSGGELEKQVKLQNYAQQMAEIPLLVTFDGEWGLAMRLKKTPSFPKSRVLGCIADNNLLYEYGREVARQFREMGVHINFAPVADVDNNPNNPVINYRSFGSNPEAVASKVIAYSRGLEDGGVMAVCKHFPGHGDTNVDSHKALPVLKFDRARLDSIELHPFRRAFREGVSGVMVGHLHVPSLSSLPASVSPEIVNGLLKKKMGFQGMVFTDALEMKGIASNAPVCANALIAGNDMLLAPRNLKRELDGVMDAIRSGKLSREEIDNKCRKVLRYKYALMYRTEKKVNMNGILQRIHNSDTDSLLARLDKAAVTIVKNNNSILPVRVKQSGTLLLSVSGSLSESYPFYKAFGEGSSLAWLRANPDSISYIQRRVQKSDRVIIAVYTRNLSPYIAMLERISHEKPVVLVMFNEIKRLNDIKQVAQNAHSVVLAHTDKPEIQQHVARVLCGRAKADGRLSVTLPGLFRAGQGVTLMPTGQNEYTPEELGMDASKLAKIDSIALDGIRHKAYPGCHVLVMRRGETVYDKCFGKHTYDGERQLQKDDIYDIASMSKTTATLLAVMKLYDEGRFGLTDKISEYLPYLQDTNKKNITISQLLFHESGIMSYYPFYRMAVDMEQCGGQLFRRRPDSEHSKQVDTYLFALNKIPFDTTLVSTKQSADYSKSIDGKLFIKELFADSIRMKIANIPLKSRTYRYSCLNFMLLKDMVERMTGVGMDQYLDSIFFRPMGLEHTSYHPLEKHPKENIVPTVNQDFLRPGILQGYVHDEAAAFLGGVSGNAGLFSNMYDIARIYQMYLNGGVLEGKRYISEETCKLFTTKKSIHSRRGLGFDKPDKRNPKYSPCAEEAPASVYGHTGFTGTSVWVDPDNELIFIFLSNRVYPHPFDHKNLMRMNIRPLMQQAVYQSLLN